MASPSEHTTKIKMTQSGYTALLTTWHEPRDESIYMKLHSIGCNHNCDSAKHVKISESFRTVPDCQVQSHHAGVTLSIGTTSTGGVGLGSG